MFIRESGGIPRLTRPKRKREFEMLHQNGRKSASLGLNNGQAQKDCEGRLMQSLTKEKHSKEGHRKLMYIVIYYF